VPLIKLVIGLGVFVFQVGDGTRGLLGLPELKMQIPQLAPLVGFIILPQFFRFCFLQFHNFFLVVLLLLLLLLLLRVVVIGRVPEMMT
jgi:hypothetical protein